MEDVETGIVLVSGANRGIGRCVADTFWRAGYHVIGTFRSRDRPHTLREVKLKYFQAGLEVRNQDSINGLIAEIERQFGRLHVLVNNAGMGVFDAAEALQRQHVQEMFDTNVVGLFALTQAICPLLLKAGGGRVINLGSIVDNINVPGNCAYGASKAAVASMTGTFNEEYKSRNIRFSLVSPGAVRTEIWDGREGFDPESMLSVDDVAQTILDIARKPLNVRIDAVRINPPYGLL